MSFLAEFHKTLEEWREIEDNLMKAKNDNDWSEVVKQFKRNVYIYFELKMAWTKKAQNFSFL